MDNEIKGYYRNENIPNGKRIINEDNPITSDDEDDKNDNFNTPDDLLEEDNEKEKEDDDIDEP